MRAIGGAGADDLWSVEQTSDGGYIAIGNTRSFGQGNRDMFIVRLDEYGDTLWIRAIGGTQDDFGSSIIETYDGYFIATGRTESFGLGGSDILLVKLSAQGDTVWTKAIGTPQQDIGATVIETADSNYVVSGLANDDALLMKFDTNGDTLWTKIYQGNTLDFAYNVVETQDGGFATVGEVSIGNAARVLLIRTDPMGDTLWTKAYDGWASVWSKTLLDNTSDGGFIIGGPGGSSINTIKTDSLGDVIYAKEYEGNSFDVGYGALETFDGKYLLVGMTSSFGGGGDDGYLIKTDTNGDTIWTRAYGGTGSEYFYHFNKCNDGGFIICGTTSSFGAGSSDGWIVKVDSMGNVGCNQFATTTTITDKTPTVARGFTKSRGMIVNNIPPVVSTDTLTNDTLCLAIGIGQLVEESDNLFTLYPNPTNGVFTVQGATGTIQVHDLFGRLVLSTNEPQIDMSGFPNGVYLVKVGEAVSLPGFYWTGKLIVNH